MTLYKSIWIGLLGSFLMFLGDMTLYYDPNDYDSKDTINNIVGTMKNVSIKRLYIGGLLGPICAFIYCIGFYHIVLGMQENYLNIGWSVFLINVFGMILGGAYHMQCAYSISFGNFIWIHSISKMASPIYTYISFDIHSSC